MTENDGAAERINVIWQHDLIGDRRKHAEFLHRYLTGLSYRSDGKRGFVLNIDAEWGAGKSYFLKRLKEHLEAKGHLVAFVDAWRDDFTDDPFIAVLHAVRLAFETKTAPEEIRDKFTAMAKQGLKVAGILGVGLLKRQAYRLVGDAVNEVFNSEDDKLVKPKGKVGKASEDDEADLGTAVEVALATAFERLGAVGTVEESAFTEAREVIDGFIESLSQLADAVRVDKDAQAPIFVLIDELDRCRPTYAIELLERVKHIFEAAGVVFIIATDTSQLGHSVKAVYGEGFDGRRYLQRFFDQTYSLPRPVGLKMVEYELDKNGCDPCDFYEIDGLSLGDQVYDMIELVKGNARTIKRAILIFSAATQARPFETKVFAPYLMLLALSHVDADEELFAALTARGTGNEAGKAFKQISQERSMRFKSRAVGVPGHGGVSWTMNDLLIQLLMMRDRNLWDRIEYGEESYRWSAQTYVKDLFEKDKDRFNGQRVNRSKPARSSFSYYAETVRAAGALSELD